MIRYRNSKRRFRTMHVCVAVLSILGWSLGNAMALAERAPRSADELQDEAELVVVGSVEEVRVGIEPAHIERGFGNRDWAIDLVIRVNDVEKGAIPDGDTIVARCFRIKSRKSLQEFLTPSGNQWIPEVKTNVRAYLYKDGALWRVIYPNGLAPMRSGDDQQDAEAVAGMGSGFTYLLPLEVWIPALIVSLPIVLGLLLIMAWRRRASATSRRSDVASQAS